jgi:hypothetical protein
MISRAGGLKSTVSTRNQLKKPEVKKLKKNALSMKV